MKIPNKIRINGIDYSIERVKELSDNGTPLSANICYHECKIRLCKKSDPQYSRVSLWHEILHAIVESVKLDLGKDEEKIVDTLAYGINQVIQDNKENLFSLKDNKQTIEDETIKRTEELVKELKASIATAVKNAKIFINDIQDGGDYAFACGIVSALKFIVDEETFIELNELLEKQTKWEQTRNDTEIKEDK